MWKMTLTAAGQKRSAPSPLGKVQDVLPMSDPITVVAYDPAWPEIFRQRGTQLRAAPVGVALHIDHLGSTALEADGFRYRAANWELGPSDA
jgi:hypothetical protein